MVDVDDDVLGVGGLVLHHHCVELHTLARATRRAHHVLHAVQAAHLEQVRVRLRRMRHVLRRSCRRRRRRCGRLGLIWRLCGR